MKKFLKKISIFILILVLYKVVLFAVVFYSLPAKSSYLYYGEKSKNNKIVLLGCSNLKYNFDYNLLNEHFAGYDVIGCQLSEPSGLFALYYKLQNLELEKDDFVVVALPHSLYETEKFLPLKNHNKSGFSMALLKECLAEFPMELLDNLFSIKIADVLKFPSKGKTKKKSSFLTTTYIESPEVHSDSLYKSCWVNEEQKFFIKSTGFDEAYLNKVILFLNKKINSKILFRYPSMRKDQFDIDKDRISFLNKKLNFINTFESSIYSSQYWYNQWYHLNKCGRDLNSKKIIQELESIIYSN